MRGSTTATATARALREKGNKAVSPGGITRCDRSTGRGLQQPGSPGGRHRTSPLSAPGCPGPAPSPAPPSPRGNNYFRTDRGAPRSQNDGKSTKAPAGEEEGGGAAGRSRPSGGTASGGRSPEPRGLRKQPPGGRGVGGGWRYPTPPEDRPRETQRARRPQPRKAPSLPPRLPAASYHGKPGRPRRLLSPRGAGGPGRPPARPQPPLTAGGGPAREAGAPPTPTCGAARPGRAPARARVSRPSPPRTAPRLRAASPQPPPPSPEESPAVRRRPLPEAGTGDKAPAPPRTGPPRAALVDGGLAPPPRPGLLQADGVGRCPRRQHLASAFGSPARPRCEKRRGGRRVVGGNPRAPPCCRFG